MIKILRFNRLDGKVYKILNQMKTVSVSMTVTELCVRTVREVPVLGAPGLDAGAGAALAQPQPRLHLHHLLRRLLADALPAHHQLRIIVKSR